MESKEVSKEVPQNFPKRKAVKQRVRNEMSAHLPWTGKESLYYRPKRDPAFLQGWAHRTSQWMPSKRDWFHVFGFCSWEQHEDSRTSTRRRSQRREQKCQSPLPSFEMWSRNIAVVSILRKTHFPFVMNLSRCSIQTKNLCGGGACPLSTLSFQKRYPKTLQGGVGAVWWHQLCSQGSKLRSSEGNPGGAVKSSSTSLIKRKQSCVGWRVYLRCWHLFLVWHCHWIRGSLMFTPAFLFCDSCFHRLTVNAIISCHGHSGTCDVPLCFSKKLVGPWDPARWRTADFFFSCEGERRCLKSSF